VNAKLGVAIAVYVGSIAAANVMTDRMGLVGVGFGLVVTAGTFAAGFALFARDFVQRYGGPAWAFAAIGVGSVLSWLMASPQLAVASTVAFAGAELADLGVFTATRGRLGFVPAIAVSNIVAAPVDTVLFLHIAGFGVTWQAVAGQMVGKLVWATAVPLALYAVGTRSRRQTTVYDEIKAERLTHEQRGYDAAHDDHHGAGHLVEWAFLYADRGDRAGLVKAASLLVAAIQYGDRSDALLRQPVDAEGA
jgi:uncharacterized PurR-regulated membrane protein YhhQ (DUF165 family)